MTRYTRAQGAKASNMRTPNEATPWHVMKEQLETNKTKSQEPAAKVKSAKQLLQEHQNLFYYDTAGDSSNWAEFDAPQQSFKKNVNHNRDNNEQKKKSQLASKRKITEVEIESPVVQERKKVKGKTGKLDLKVNKFKTNGEDNDTIQTDVQNVAETVQKKNSKKKKKPTNDTRVNASSKELSILPTKRKLSKTEDNSGVIEKGKKHKKESTTEADTNDSNLKIKKKEKIETGKSDTHENEVVDAKSKKKQKKKKEEIVNDEEHNTPEPPDTEETKVISENNDQEKLTKRQKRNFKKKNQNLDISNNRDDGVKNSQNNSFSINRFNDSNRNFNQFDGRKPQRPSKNNHQTPGKIRDDKEHKRRKPPAPPTKLIINGIEVEVSTFGGFPVKREDAERLEDLRKQMIMKGIPKKDMDAALKLERRRAEKALTRIKKEVCYHCRKAGHLLSDCPELGREEAGTGICFKCGSTEHTHFECKVARPTEFRFAKCFICREQGHIAKQCPDNPKGVYPQGGACKICGDVTHLKKDCPDLIKEKEETIMTLDTIENDTIESLEGNKKPIDTVQKTAKSKIVKF